jgi:PKHD-type hydroxylase
MNLEHYYWYFKKGLPINLCDEIIKSGKQQESKLGLTGATSQKDLERLSKKEKKKKFRTRHSDVSWLNAPWIYNAILPFLNKANKAAGWNFEHSRAEDCQFTIYTKNHHYTWHCDGWHQPYDSSSPYQGLVRKLSLSVSLSNPNEYKGGELQFDFRNCAAGKNIHTCDAMKEKGSIVIFPSFVWHRVTPVTEGTRYSLVNWIVGKNFK